VRTIFAFLLKFQAKIGSVRGQDEIHTQNKLKKNRFESMIPIECNHIHRHSSHDEKLRLKSEEIRDLDQLCRTNERKRARSDVRHSSATPEPAVFQFRDRAAVS
jgi:hypothetical protein